MIGWLFNLDAEEELFHGVPVGPAARVPASALRALADPGSPCSPLETGDRIIGAGQPPPPGGTPVVPWCPTPSVRRSLAEIGLQPAFDCEDDVLRRVCARGAFAGRGTLPDVRVCTDVAEVQRAVERPAPARAPALTPGSPKAPAWLLRASFCAAGRRRLVAEEWSDDVGAFAERQLAGGPVIVSPMVDIGEEYGVHGLVLPAGEVRVGTPMAQRVGGGAWQSSQPLAPGHGNGAALGSVARAIGVELRELGFCGPYGVDGFQWRDGAGTERLHAPSEVNPRLTMGFARSGLLPVMRRALRSTP